MTVFSYEQEEVEFGKRLYRIAKDLQESSQRLENALEMYRLSEQSDAFYGLIALAVLPTRQELAKTQLSNYEALCFYKKYKNAIETEQYPSSETVMRDNQESHRLIPLANMSWELQYHPRPDRIKVDQTLITALEITFSMVKMKERE